MKRVLKIFLLGVALLVVLALVFVTFFLSSTARYVVNRQLPDLLGTEVQVEDLRVGLWSGRVDLRGLVIGQPEGFEGEPLLSLNRFSLRFSPRSLIGSRMRIERIEFEGPAIYLIRNTDGLLNIETIAAQFATDEPGEETGEAGPLPGLWLGKFEVRDLAVTVRDEADPELTTTVKLSDLFFGLEDFEIGPAEWSELWDNAFTLALMEVSGARLLVERMAPEPVSVEPVSPEEVEELAEEIDPQVDLAEMEPIESRPLPPFFLGELRLSDLHFTYVDGSVDPEEPYTLVVELSGLSGKALQSATMDPERSAEGSLEGALKILQPHGVPVRIGLEARVDPLEGGVPTTAGFLRLTGLDLLTFEPFLVPGIETTLGGSVFDLRADWQVSPEFLDLRAALVSHREVETRVRVRGTPDDPVFSGSEIFLSLLARPGQMLTNLAGDTLAVGTGIVTGVTSSATDLAADAGRTVGRLGAGVLGAGERLLRGDVRGAGAALTEGVTEATETAVEGVTRAGEGVGATATGAVTADRGSERRSAFLEAAGERHQERLEAAREWLAELSMRGWGEAEANEEVSE